MEAKKYELTWEALASLDSQAVAGDQVVAVDAHGADLVPADPDLQFLQLVQLMTLYLLIFLLLERTYTGVRFFSGEEGVQGDNLKRKL